MDKAVKKALCAALLLAGGAAGAQALQDPTRPPASLIAAANAGAGQGAAAPAGPQLQTILIGRAPGGRHLAVIDGQTLRPGDDFHGARVARIADNEVELVRGRERQVLRLTPKDAGGMSPATALR